MPLLLCLLLVLLLAAPADAGSWRRPVDGVVLRDFRLGRNPYAAGQHRGVDLAAPIDAAVRAACSGRVSFSGRVPGGGVTISTRCGPLIATYQQLGSVAVRRGQAVAAGTPLGTVGRSGRPSEPEPHVHLGVREAASGRYLDPLTLFGAGSPGLPLLRGPEPRGVPPPANPEPLRGPRPRAARSPVRAQRPRGAPAPTPEPRVGPAPALEPRVGPAPTREPLAPAPRLDGRRPISQGQWPAGAPWPVWVGLACVGLGLPVGGFVQLRRRRRRTDAVGARVARSA